MTKPSVEQAVARPYRGVLLVGFMASGKSSVGRRLAQLLGWRFVDVDEAVEGEAGKPIWKLFEEEGERGFRAREARIVEEWLSTESVVLVPGGGWPAVEGRMETCPPDYLSVWLKVSAATSLNRARQDSNRRPLLEGADPQLRAADLLLRRSPYYSRARIHIDSEVRGVDELADAIAARVAEGSEPTKDSDP